MEEICEAMHMPMYSRYGKAQAAFVNIPIVTPRKTLHRTKPHRQQMDNEKITNMIQELMAFEEQKHDSQLLESKKSLSAAFLAVSRQQRDQSLKSSNADTPGPTKYYTNEALIRPKTTYNYRMRAPTTNPRAQRVTLASCISERSVTCKFAKKVYCGIPIGKKTGEGQQRKVMDLEEFHKVVHTEEAEYQLKSLPVFPRSFSFQKQISRKGISQQTVSDSRFDLINHFPPPYTGSKRVCTADFGKATSRKDMFTVDFVDGVYDSHPERCKTRTNVCLCDYNKMSSRESQSQKLVPESPDFERLEKGYHVCLPHTHVAKINISKMSPRPGTAGPGLSWMGYISSEAYRSQSQSSRKLH